MTSRLFDLTDQVAFVTGAGQGLGRAMAVGLAQSGADIAAIDIDFARAQDAAQQVGAVGARALALRCDVSQSADVLAAVEETVAALGRIDILVNNAGITYRMAAEEMPEKEWDRVMAVNLKGMFLCCQAVGKVMIRQGGGRIINMASIGGQVALTGGNTAYCASKGGVISLTRTLAVEWAEFGIRVNALAPTHFRTPLVAKVLDDPVRGQEILAAIPMGRVGEPHEMVGPVVFLASRASSMVTGHVLNVDGGTVAK